MASRPQHIAFISAKCPWSKAFLEELSKTPYLNEFNVVVYEKSRSQFPKWVEKTPTIVIKGEKDPRTDAEVMNWLYERKMADSAKQGVTMPRKAGDPAAAAEPEAWNQNELGVGIMAGNSGGFYSFLGSDTNTNGTGGHDIPGNFSFLNGGASPGQRGVDLYPGGGGGEKKTKREQMFDQQMEDYMKHRDVGMPKGPARV